MKILELRFKNLNSLYGEWVIDFTDPEYVAGGIFSMTGPTGAGKSTILDAICLALYWATPRLGKITKSGNEIMSRQTAECYAEVLFESQAGRSDATGNSAGHAKKWMVNCRIRNIRFQTRRPESPSKPRRALSVASLKKKPGWTLIASPAPFCWRKVALIPSLRRMMSRSPRYSNRSPAPKFIQKSHGAFMNASEMNKKSSWKLLEPESFLPKVELADER